MRDYRKRQKAQLKELVAENDSLKKQLASLFLDSNFIYCPNCHTTIPKGTL